MPKPRKRRTKGTGSVRLRGRVWWITYYAGGRPVAESSGSEDKQVAVDLLSQRLGELSTGQNVTPSRATIHDLCQLVIADYRVCKRHDLKMVEWRYKANIKPALGRIQVNRWSASNARQFIADRRASGASDATINRELSVVRRGFTLGFQEEPPLVRRVPHIPTLDEDNARQGYLAGDHYAKLLATLPERLKALFVCAYHVGTRKGELRKVRWDQVDFEAGLIRLEKAQTKTKTSRSLPIYGEMEYWLRFQQERATEGCRWVFFHRTQPVGAQLRGWREACIDAGVPNLLFHDLRRTAVRNMRLAGLDQSQRMVISGHKTATMEQRYNIVDSSDVLDAGKKLREYYESNRAKLKLVENE